MIVETLINILFLPVVALLDFLPDFSWTIQLATESILFQLFSVAMYILPHQCIIHILSMVFIITLIRIVISVVKLVLNALPFF